MRRHAAAAVLAVVLGATGCAAGASDAGAGFDEAAFEDRWTAAEQGGLDYQLGGASDVGDDVTVVVRDREAPPAGVVLDVCYVNAFQTQPGELEWWSREHPELLLRDAAGDPVADPAWPDERILDSSTPSSRAAIAEIVGEWIDGCARAGFEAVELDNLDAWTRVDGLSQAGTLALASMLVDRAHAAGLAAAQKNALEAGQAGAAAGFDLVITEECARFDECGAYGALHDRHLAVEYAGALPDGATFAAVCDRPGQPPLMVLRDAGLAPRGDPAHILERC
ncbi:endo alpha-1,4 polygalactosaminidase [Agrococcus citreus]|uniref:Endo alpha-1,4 polygalactosaminidase n=1 Tax=Agrococcus citreus TaxID=84643 RepID=A0ABP4JDN9_9MICO